MRLAAIVLTALLVGGSECAAQRRSAVPKAEFWGFAAPWDPQSDSSIRAHGRRLDAIVSGWIGLDSISGRPLLPSPYADTIRPRGTARMAIVTSWHGERFHQEPVRALSRNPRALGQTAGTIARHARAMGYTGLVLDFETLEAADLDAQLRVMKSIADSARAYGVTMIAAAVPALDTSAYPARPLLGVADVIVLMLYDQHWLGSAPGPLSAPDWVREALALRIKEAGADRIVAGLPTYAYRWLKGLPTEHLGYNEARRISASTRSPLRRDAATGTLRAQAAEWEMWVTDAHLLRRLVQESAQAGVRRFAFWRLGREDPAIWETVVR